jgi:hypothetical protein
VEKVGWVGAGGEGVGGVGKVERSDAVICNSYRTQDLHRCSQVNISAKLLTYFTLLTHFISKCISG